MDDEDALVTDEATEERVIQFIELLPTDQILAFDLLAQAKKLRKVCPECDGNGFITIAKTPNGNYVIDDCHTCYGTGSIPVGPEDVEVKLKGEK